MVMALWHALPEQLQSLLGGAAALSAVLAAMWLRKRLRDAMLGQLALAEDPAAPPSRTQRLLDWMDETFLHEDALREKRADQAKHKREVAELRARGTAGENGDGGGKDGGGRDGGDKDGKDGKDGKARRRRRHESSQR